MFASVGKLFFSFLGKHLHCLKWWSASIEPRGLRYLFFLMGKTYDRKRNLGCRSIPRHTERVSLRTQQYFLLLLSMPGRRMHNSLEKWRWSPFIAWVILYNFIKVPVPWKLLDQGFPRYLLINRDSAVTINSCIWLFHRVISVSPSQWILVSCTLANTIPVFCLAVNGRLCPHVV